jgi:oxygen-dependent protoporphyrinogen oxidase
MLLLRCFVGGALDEATLRADDETLVAGALEELRRLIGLSAKPRFWRVSRWPRAMAQYAVGHQQRMKEVDARLAGLRGLYLAGNAYTGIGVPDCVRMGKEAAAQIGMAWG